MAMWFDHQDTVINLATKRLGELQEIQHLPPENNFVWSVEAGAHSYIVKIGPVRPYRLRREIRAYDHLSGNDLPIPTMINSGEIERIPFLILTRNGNKTAEDLFAVDHESVEPGLISRILAGLHCLSGLHCKSFDLIKNGVTTRDRDVERLEYTRSLAVLKSIHLDLLDRIESVNSRPYSQMAHRDFSPRQVVLNGNGATLIDFESIGPGLLERDIGDFIGGILKFGIFQAEYGLEVVRFAATNGLACDLISDHAIYSLLWSIAKSTPVESVNMRLDLATKLLNNKDWLTTP